MDKKSEKQLFNQIRRIWQLLTNSGLQYKKAPDKKAPEVKSPSGQGPEAKEQTAPKMAVKIDDKDVRQIANMVMRMQEEREMQRLSRELRARGKIICATSKTVNANYAKLSAGHTLDIRYLCLTSCILEVLQNNIPGDFAEFGVFRGGFAKRIHALAPDRHLYLFDTFAGFDQEQFTRDLDTYKLKPTTSTAFRDTSVEIVLQTIGGNRELLHPVQGLFPASAEAYKDKKFAFVSLDVDLYQPMRDGIEFFYPRLSPGGYIMIHDFHDLYFKGVHDAIMEYVKKEHITFVPVPDVCGSVVISKPF